MPPRNTRRGRQAAPPSAEASYSLQNENIGNAPTPPPLHQQEINIPPTAPRAKRFEQLRKLGATPFVGTLDPAEAESWLENTERVFNLVQCTTVEKYDYDVFVLQGDAYNWWKTVPQSLVQPPVLSWDDFLREYHEKYTPAVYKREKRQEFVTLEQGSM